MIPRQPILCGLLLALALTQGIFGQETSTKPSAATAPSQPVPDAAGVYRPGHGVTPPESVYQEPFDVSDQAIKRKLYCLTNLSVTVDVNGLPQDVRIVKATEDVYKDKKDHAAGVAVDAKAVETVKRYRFKPGMLNGKPVPVRMNIELTYTQF